MAEVLESLYAARADGTYRKVFRRVTTPDLLILDGAGFADLHREAANELFRVVCARDRQRSTIVVILRRTCRSSRGVNSRRRRRPSRSPSASSEPHKY